MRSLISALTLLVLTACGTDEQWELQTLDDEGSVCLAAEADATGTIVVDSQECMSSSCSRAQQGTCTATLDGTTITVTSSFSWEQATGNVDCTEDCGQLATSCQVGPLPAGEYTVVHGDDSQTITVPTEDPCAL